MRDLKRIGITGGPRGGKDEVLAAVGRQFGSQVYVVPELATMLLAGGFPLPGRDLAWSEEWQDAFQAALIGAQPHLERACEIAAVEQGALVILFNRTRLDGAAYTPGGVTEFCRRYGVDYEAALGLYTTVLHLESTATGDPEDYLRDIKAGNASRFESLELAEQRELALREAWQAHPEWTFLSCIGGVEGKIRAACQMVRAMIAA